MDYVANDRLLDLSGRTAIVTGAVGIGFGIAARLAEAGANVVVASMIDAEVRETVGTLTAQGWHARGVTTDVAKEDDVERMVATAASAYGGVDILVNNAGIYPSIPVHQMTLPQFRKVLAVNLEGVFLCTKHVAAQMIRQGRGGKIINITSIDALHPSAVGLAHYDASKHGVWGFTKNIALELAPHRIWVNAIAPGGILTPGVQAQERSLPAAPDGQTGDVMEAFMAKIPMRRLGVPDDIGKVALFLASDMSSYMTGSQIVVDGGVLLT